MSFRSEAEMSALFRQVLGPRVKNEGLWWLQEVDGDVGIPDYLLVKTTDATVTYVVAVELKIRDWHRGLLQAFRYRNFANEVYVVLDRHYVARALANVEHFIRAGVGLGSFDNSGAFLIHALAHSGTPFSKNLSERVMNRVSRLATAGSGDPDFMSLSCRFARSRTGRLFLRGFTGYVTRSALRS